MNFIDKVETFDDNRATERVAKVYLIDDCTAAHGMEHIEENPLTQKKVQKNIEQYVKYFGGSYLKSESVLVNNFGRRE